MLYGLQLYSKSSEDDLLYILAYIEDNCNYNCSYCYNIKPYTKIQLNLIKLYKYIQYIKQKYPTKYIQLELIGGEPTLHPDLLDFCKKVSNIDNILIKIFTNLSASILLYNSLLINKNIILIASWHSLKNDLLNINYITKIIQLLKKYKNQIEVRIMYEIFNTKNALNVANEILPYSNNMLFDLSFLFNPNSKLPENTIFEYTKQQLNNFNIFHNQHNIRSNRKEFLIRYNDNTEELKTFTDMFCNKSYNFKRWLCNAGKNSLYIDYDGSVYPCVEYSCDNKKPIFNINNSLSYLNYKFKPILCKLEFCSCDWDIKKKKIF